MSLDRKAGISPRGPCRLWLVTLSFFLSEMETMGAFETEQQADLIFQRMLGNFFCFVFFMGNAGFYPNSKTKESQGSSTSCPARMLPKNGMEGKSLVREEKGNMLLQVLSGLLTCFSA